MGQRLTSLGSSLTGNLGERVFLEAGIEDCIGDLITGGNNVSTSWKGVYVRSQNLRDLVRMSLTDRLGGEEEGVALPSDAVGDGSSSHDGRRRGDE